MKTHAKRMIPVLASLAMALGAPNRIQAEEQSGTEGGNKLSESDQQFVTEAARGGMLEVQAAEAARSKATNQGLKDLAERIATDHGKANEELKDLASRKGVTLPNELGDQERSHLDRLNRLSGAEFDREFSQMMVQDHEQHLKLFRDASERVQDNDLKAFASRTAGIIEQHLEAARQLHTQLGTSGEGQQSTSQQGAMQDRETTGKEGQETTHREKSTTREKSVTRDKDAKGRDDAGDADSDRKSKRESRRESRRERRSEDQE